MNPYSKVLQRTARALLCATEELTQDCPHTSTPGVLRLLSSCLGVQRSLLDALLVPVPVVNGLLWPNCWVERDQNYGEIHHLDLRCKLKRPMLRQCYAELLKLSCGHVTWQFWHVTLGILSKDIWIWHGRKHGGLELDIFEVPPNPSHPMIL